MPPPGGSTFGSQPGSGVMQNGFSGFLWKKMLFVENAVLYKTSALQERVLVEPSI